MEQNIVLMGFMGVGKSTIGRRLATQLGFTFVDTDALIVESAGKPIPQIFADEGEQGFRAREIEAVANVASQNRLIIATGGGAVVNPLNAARLRASGLTVLLTAKPEILLKRVGDRRTRPMLAHVENPLAHIIVLNAQRAPFYERAAELVVDTTDKLPESILEEILVRYREQERIASSALED